MYGDPQGHEDLICNKGKWLLAFFPVFSQDLLSGIIGLLRIPSIYSFYLNLIEPVLPIFFMEIEFVKIYRTIKKGPIKKSLTLLMN